MPPEYGDAAMGEAEDATMGEAEDAAMGEAKHQEEPDDVPDDDLRRVIVVARR